MKRKIERTAVGEVSKIGAIAMNKTKSRQVAGKKQQSKQSRTGYPPSGDIAVIGMACRFPGAENHLEYWEELRLGISNIGEIPPERWNWRNYWGDPKTEVNKSNCKWGGFIKGVAEFDAEFFGLSAREAEIVDPQQRIMLELAWSCFEDAGIRPSRVSGTKVGVFIGTFNYDYKELQERMPVIEVHHSTGTACAVIPNRISHYFNLRGPSFPVDAACSGSLYATHLAIQSLLLGECEMALAGGISLLLTPTRQISFAKTGMLSPTGSCKTFDDAADGYVRSEGAGLILLKPLQKALEDGDPVYGVIKGSAANHSGKTHTLTYPNPEAQAEVIAEAWRRAGITAESISYIETHGTGTPKGDPLEFQGLLMAFQALNASKGPKGTANYCGLGSVKTNIGHLESAAGVAGLIKVLLALGAKQLPGLVNFQKLNHRILLEESPFYIVEKLREWKELTGKDHQALPRRAGVSSFGFGGTNAHVAVEAAPVVTGPARPEYPFYLICLSAKTEAALRQKKQEFVHWLETTGKESEIIDICAILLRGRDHFNVRTAYVVRNSGELQARLHQDLEAGLPRKGTANHCGPGVSKEMGQAVLQEFQTDCLLAEADCHEKLLVLAELYQQGYDLDGTGLYRNVRVARISPPTYPFSKKRYWLPFLDNVKNELPATAIPQRKACYLSKQWEDCPADFSGRRRRAIVILTTDQTRGLASELAKLFDQFEIINSNDLASSYCQTPDEWKKYGGVVDLTGCGAAAYELGWIGWLQHLLEHGEKDGLVLLGVTRGLESFQNRTVNPAGAARVGLYRMLQSEYHQVRSRHIDGDPAGSDPELAAQIAAELCADSNESEVCYRQGKRFRACLRESTEAFAADRPLVFPPGHVLWITGGTRGLGYLCAQHFVRRYGVKQLVLTGRETLPPREEWETTGGLSASVVQKIRAIRDLESLGAQVDVYSIRLSEEQALRQACQEIKSKAGPIGGVVHAAGFWDKANPALIRKTPPGIARVVEPKILGFNTVYEIFKQEPLRFLLLFSSVAATIPSLASGMSDYAMANAYLDYAAETYRSVCPVISIQWPSWKETGMGEVKSQAYGQTGLLSLTDREGLDFLDRILARKNIATVMPLMVNPDLWQPDQLMRHSTPPLPQAESGLEAPGAALKKAAPLLPAVENWLTALFAAELKTDTAVLGADTPLQEYGVDSILLAQAVARIEQKLGGKAVEPSALLEYPTLKSLAGYLTTAYADDLSPLLTGTPLVKEGLDGPESSGPDGGPPSSRTMPLILPATEPEARSKIAIVGMACHFPDAGNIKAFWENLRSSRDSIREVPKSRWDWEKYYAVEYQTGKSLSKWGAFLEAIEQFDPEFFKIPPSLAPQIDPLQRQWLEVSVEALADAGLAKEDLWGKSVGVYVGARTANFAKKLDEFQKDVLVGTGQNFIAAHLAHIYNFKGPNMVVDTACSSSLTAIHLAARCLQSGEAEVALAGGVEILLDESIYLALSAAKILSPRGRCKTFDSAADGIGLGEGCGALVLKPLSRAIRDQDKIYGVLDGSALNNDGNTMGITTPNPQAQQELIEKALGDAGINPETISYIETHGTGTFIGDPIELKALMQVFNRYTVKKQFCGIGSVKTNLGHLLSAAGIAGVIKVLLAINRQELPPTLHCSQPNPRFDFGASPFYPVREPTAWLGWNGILRAGISAFGLGGNNAHIIVSNVGIPEMRRASLEPRGEQIVFKRKRYWPDQTAGPGRTQRKEPDAFTARNATPGADDFMEFFHTVKLEGGEE